jgi:hypothetical protein
MMFPIAYRRMLACYVAVSGELRRTDCGTTLGGQDKRCRAARRYVVVVHVFFARRADQRRAASSLIPLIPLILCRATAALSGVP